jgi:predicted phage baseplate assembly protein
VDIEEDRRASLRFGLRGQGMQPQPGDQFQVTYRVGSGAVGNVRADALTHIVTDDPRVLGVHNPLAAESGTDPQPLEEVRLNAPYAFHTPLHCVTTDDYATVALRYPQVTGAVARLRRVGSRPVICVYVQRADDQPVDATFAADLARFMRDFRVIGHEIEIRGPYFVALSLTLRSYLHRSAVRSVTSKALAQTFGTGDAGFFRAGRFTFGQHVYQSQVIAWAMRVSGVTRVEVELFHRLDAPDPPCVDAVLIQPLEIARLNNDLAASYNGLLHIVLEGGL